MASNNLHAKDIKNLSLNPPVFYLDGDDVFWHDAAVAYFKALVSGEFESFNLKTVDSTLEDALNATQALPLMSDFILIYVRDLSQKAKEGEKSMLKKYLVAPVYSAILLFETDAVLDASDKKLMTKIECKRLPETENIEYVKRLAAEIGIKISNFHAQSLVSFNNGDLARIRFELIKLHEYAGDTLTDGDFMRVAIPDTEHQIFELSNALATKNKNFALLLLADMRRRGESSAAILSMLSNQYRRMLHATVSTASDDELVVALGVKNSYAIKKARECAAKYTKLQLKSIVELLTDLEFRFKSGELLNEVSALDIAIGELINL